MSDSRRAGYSALRETIRCAGGGAAVLVGDSITDVETARGAGLPCVVLIYGYRDRPAEDLGATLLIDGFERLVDALTRVADFGGSAAKALLERKRAVRQSRQSMGHPRRSRLIALGFAASGVAAVLAAFELPSAAAADWVRTALFIYGSTAILFGGGTALFWHFDVRAMARLARGEEIIARWRVEPAAWREFLAGEQQRIANGDVLPNELSIPTEIPEQGIEVIAGRAAVQIGESIHRLTSGMPEVTAATLLEGRPAVIELQLYYPGGGSGASGVPRAAARSALRFPVGRGYWKEAGAVVAHYRGDAPRKPDFFHGKGDGSNPEDLSRCYHCGYQTYKLMSHCPQCGRSMQSKRWSRRLGCILVPAGLFISVLMGWVLLAIGPALLHPGASRFTGTQAEGLGIAALLGAVEIFGVTAFCYGLWQMATGRRSRWVIYFAVGLAVILFLVALLI